MRWTSTPVGKRSSAHGQADRGSEGQYLGNDPGRGYEIAMSDVEQIRRERDEAVRQRDRLRREAFELTKRIFRLNFREEKIEKIRQERAQA